MITDDCGGRGTKLLGSRFTNRKFKILKMTKYLTSPTIQISAEHEIRDTW
jgi:hypothetical protein